MQSDSSPYIGALFGVLGLATETVAGQRLHDASDEILGEHLVNGVLDPAQALLACEVP